MTETELERLIVRLVGDGTSYQKMLSQAEKTTTDVTGRIGVNVGKIEAFGGSLKGYASSAVGSLIPLIGVASSLGAVFKGVSLANDMEQLEVSFKVLTGSAEVAQKTLGDLTRFAAETPFQMPEIVNAAKQMLGFGETAENIVPTMKKLGDVASGLNIPIGDLTYLFGTLKSQGRAFTVDINQFASRGIPIWDELGKMFGKTNTQVRAMVEAGKVGFKDVEKAFTNMTSKGGKFFNMMDEQSQTLAGLYSTMKDNLDGFLRELGKEVIVTLKLKEIVRELGTYALKAVDWFKGLSPAVKRVAIVGAALAVAVGGMILLLPVLGTVLGALLSPFTSIMSLVSTVGSLLVGLFTAAIGTAVTVVGGFISAVVTVAGAIGSLVVGIIGVIAGIPAFIAGVSAMITFLAAFGVELLVVAAVAAAVGVVLTVLLSPLLLVGAALGVVIVAAGIAVLAVVGLVGAVVGLAGFLLVTVGPLGVVVGLVGLLAATVIGFVTKSGGVVGAWNRIQTAAENAWEWLKPVRAAAISFWNELMAAAARTWEFVKEVSARWFSYVEDQLTQLGESTGITWDSIRDGLVDAFIVMEFAVANFESIAEFAWTAIQLGAVTAFEEIEYWVTEALPAGWEYLVDTSIAYLDYFWAWIKYQTYSTYQSIKQGLIDATVASWKWATGGWVSTAYSALSSIVSGTVSAAKGIGGALQSIPAREIASGVWGAMTDMLKTHLKVAVALVRALPDLMASGGDIESVWNNLLDASGFKKQVDESKKEVEKGVAEVKEALGDLSKPPKPPDIKDFVLPPKVVTALEKQLKEQYEKQKNALGESFDEFRKRRLSEMGVDPEQLKEIEKKGGEAGKKMGEAYSGELGKEVGKVDAVLVGSAESMSRLAEYREKILNYGKTPDNANPLQNGAGDRNAMKPIDASSTNTAQSGQRMEDYLKSIAKSTTETAAAVKNNNLAPAGF